MGNRAVIATTEKDLGIYLHWNGGRDSIEAFLKYCELKEFRAPDDSYGWARLTQVISNFFGGGLSIGINSYDKLDTDNCDNGVYIIKGWEIVGREFFTGEEQKEYDLIEMLNFINEAQPEASRLDPEIIEGLRDPEQKIVNHINKRIENALADGEMEKSDDYFAKLFETYEYVETKEEAEEELNAYGRNKAIREVLNYHHDYLDDAYINVSDALEVVNLLYIIKAKGIIEDLTF